MSLTKTDIKMIREVVREEVSDRVDSAKEEICEDFRSRITAVQDAVVRFHQEWCLGVPPMVKVTLDNHEKRIAVLEK